MMVCNRKQQETRTKKKKQTRKTEWIGKRVDVQDAGARCIIISVRVGRVKKNCKIAL